MFYNLKRKIKQKLFGTIVMDLEKSILLQGKILAEQVKQKKKIKWFEEVEFSCFSQFSMYKKSVAGVAQG